MDICINRLSLTLITNYIQLTLPVEKSDHPTHTQFFMDTPDDDNNKNNGNKKLKINLFPFSHCNAINLYLLTDYVTSHKIFTMVLNLKLMVLSINSVKTVFP